MNKELDIINKKIIKPINPRDPFYEKVIKLYWNLWGQFGFKKGEYDDLEITWNLDEYVWSIDAKKSFYSIPQHALIVEGMIDRDPGIYFKWAKKMEPKISR